MTRHRTTAPDPRTSVRLLTRAVTAAATTSLLALSLAAPTGAPSAAPATSLSTSHGAAPETAAATSTTPATGPAARLAAHDLALAGTTSLTPLVYERRVQRQVNIRRARHGLPRLRLASCPHGTARRWSRYLAVNDAFYHQSMTSVLDQCNARYAGETLGRGTIAPNTLVRMWMQSPPHRDILLSRKSRRVGVGATRDPAGRWVVAANFVRF
jgi:uncharacterized protein YkwD